MMTPEQLSLKLKQKITPQGRAAFLSAFFLGLLIHLPIMLSDIPNHDGLSSMYFDQNMITSGRWFLTVACGFSSYFTIPWVIGLLGMLFLGGTALFLVDLLEIKGLLHSALIAGLLVAFPALSSTFAYVFTLDGYMMALLFAVLSVWFTKQYKKGFLLGAVALALSMGTYQAYLSFAVLLCIYQVLMLCLEQKSLKEKLQGVGKYLGMGVLGMILYYGMLMLLLAIQGKQLDTYQGINEMGSGLGLTASIVRMYRDFVAFTLKGQVLFHGGYSLAALLCLAICTLICLIFLCKERKLWKNLWFFGIMFLVIVGLPIATNLIIVVSPNVTYHLLMRYQWVVFLILMLAIIDRFAPVETKKVGAMLRWGAFVGAAVLLLHYGVTDNIAYANMEKKYEKTYAYCVRLLDRIEQTPGYYPGIPIAMIGVVGDEQFPVTDITGEITDHMIGTGGDYLLYTGANYRSFMKHYLGATLNILDAESMAEAYYRPEYVEMDSFPGENSIRILDGIMYIKTENVTRD